MQDYQAMASAKSSAGVKNFLQTAQFSAKFLAGKHGDTSYPSHSDLTKKNVRFHWGQEQEEAFQQIKDRLCSDDVLVPYDTSLETRLYVDSSPVGTQATVAQKHHIDHEDVWRQLTTPPEPGHLLRLDMAKYTNKHFSRKRG